MISKTRTLPRLLKDYMRIDKLAHLKTTLKRRYRNGPDNIGRDFIAKCLECAKLYRRGTGFFSSSALSAYASSMERIVRERTKLEIICSPVIQDRALYEVLKSNVSNDQKKRTLQKLGDEIILKAIGYGLNTDRRDYRKDLLAYLIAKNILEIKFAIPHSPERLNPLNEVDSLENSNLYHVKMGYFVLEDDSKVVFDGSFNESESGHQHHVDQTQVWRSWYHNEDLERMEDLIASIDEDWNGQNPYIIQVSVSNEVLEAAKRIAPSERPRRPEGSNLPIRSGEVTTGELRDYQKNAIKEWRGAGYKGIISLATGTGKTRTAIGIIKLFRGQFKNGLAVVTVPYQPLADQWIEELRKHNIQTTKVYENANEWKQGVESYFQAINRERAPENARVLVCVNKTFQDDVFGNLMRYIKNTTVKKLLIIDECHHFNRRHAVDKLYEIFDYRLGLSATPYEPGQTKYLEKYFGTFVYSYSIADAIRDNYLSSYSYHPIFVLFSPEEVERFIKVAEELQHEKSEEAAEHSELSERLSEIAENLVAKLEKLEETLLTLGRKKHTLFYCGFGSIQLPNGEVVRQISAVTRLLDRLNWNVAQITSEVKNQESRSEILNHFKSGAIDAIASMRILDEGIDIPNCEYAFILASQRTQRQGIQRRGRVLRQSESKETAKIFDFIIYGPQLSNRQLEKFYGTELERAKLFANDAINRIECMDAINQVWGTR